MTPRHFVPLLFALLLLSACAARNDSGESGGSSGSASENALRQEYVADLMLSAGRANLAEEGYAKALIDRPGDAALRVKHGRALLRLDRAGDAWAEFGVALAASPDLAEAHLGAGQAALRLGRGGEAREAFGRAVALAPDNWRGRSLLGVALLNAGEAEAARREFLAALALPGSLPGRDELLNNLGLAEVLAGNPEAALKAFHQAVREARDPERSANNLGLLLVRLNRPADALTAFRMGGNDARALNNLGYALFLQGHAHKAQALFEKALDLSPRYYEAAGENLKLAVRGAAQTPQAPSPGQALSSPSVSPGREQEQPAPEQRGAAYDVSRMSLSTGDAPLQRFGPASLLEGARPSTWTR